MSKFILLAETGSDTPAEIAAKYGITLVPMHVGFGDVTKDDGSFPVTEVFDFYKKTGQLTRTAGCNVPDFEKVFDSLHAMYPDKHILYLAYSAVTTCSYQSAVIASEGRDYITAIDTKHCTAGQCYVLILTARYLEQHPDATLEEMKEKIAGWVEAVHFCFIPGDLDYLRAGGRVSNAAYLGARILSINPLIEVLGGELKATRKIRGSMDRVVKKLTPEYIDQYNLSRDLIIFDHSPGLAEETKAAAEAIAREKGFKEILWCTCGGVISTHSGPGAFGIAGLSLN